MASSVAGTETLSFDSNSAGDLPIDYRDGVVQSATLNGQSIAIEPMNGHLILPAVADHNTLTVTFTSNSAPAGKAITRYDDWTMAANTSTPSSCARIRWLEQRERELLPTRYVHAVFTLPRELAPLALQNKRLILRDAGKPPINTVAEPARSVSGGPVQRAMSDTRAAGSPPLKQSRHQAKQLAHLRGGQGP